MGVMRSMNIDIMHRIYDTVKSKSVNTLLRGVSMMVVDKVSMVLTDHRDKKSARLTTTNDDGDHPTFDLTRRACKWLV